MERGDKGGSRRRPAVTALELVLLYGQWNCLNKPAVPRATSVCVCRTVSSAISLFGVTYSVRCPVSRTLPRGRASLGLARSLVRGFVVYERAERHAAVRRLESDSHALCIVRTRNGGSTFQSHPDVGTENKAVRRNTVCASGKIGKSDDQPMRKRPSEIGQ